MRFDLFVAGFLLGMIFGSFALVGVDSSSVEVSVSVIEEIEEGDVVEVINGEFENEQAEVVNVDEINEKVAVSLLDEERIISMRLDEVRIVRKKEELGTLRIGMNFVFVLTLVVVFLFVLWLFFRKRRKKKKKSRKKRKKRKPRV